MSSRGPLPVVAFAVSRFFGLYPAYWFSIALAIMSSYWFLSTPVPVNTLLVNMTMFHAILKVPDFFTVYWTFIIEMFFYISCAALFSVGLLGRVSVRFGAAVGLLVLALMFDIGLLRPTNGAIERVLVSSRGMTPVL
ncbi:hypothetical protein [Pseudomonas sp. LT1P18]|uniref:hypothetical protein n=1 Tax=Pseudomonas arabinosi TaxID=3398357 RepID=UPI0039F01BF2